jgi:hypothetical protein
LGRGRCPVWGIAEPEREGEREGERGERARARDREGEREWKGNFATFVGACGERGRSSLLGCREGERGGG